MSFGLKLELRQTQQLVMTPQLQQAIRLLAMSNLELADFVSDEVEKNPLLKVQNPELPIEAVEPAAPATLTTPDGAPRATDTTAGDQGLARETFDTGTENLHDSSPSDGPNPLGDGHRSAPGHRQTGIELRSLEDRLATHTDLRTHLRAQLGYLPDSDSTPGLAARYLVEELDQHGYLRTDLVEIAERLGIAPGIARAALARVQSCEPTGVGARSVGECLGLQLAERNRLDPVMSMLLDNLELLTLGDLKRLRARCGVDAEELAEMLAELHTLDPRPCAALNAEEPETLVPDILLSRASWGGWHLELNPETLPRVLIDRTYRARIGTPPDDATRQFLTNCDASAAWLVKSLDQRARTILRVATEIVRRQERFFKEGISGLRPLTLKDIAAAIDIHESTASRVTANKYIATDRGIFELKFFFTNAVGGGGGDIAATAVRHRIKAIVACESQNSVMSDDAIVEKLHAEGIDVARRTVAKYRKSLHIPSSVERRRQHVMTAGL